VTCASNRIQVQRPAPAFGLERKAAQVRAQDQRLRREIRPDRRHRHDLIAGVDQRLHRQHQRVDAARSDGDAVAGDLAVQTAHVVGHRIAQFGQAEIVGIEGLALLQRFDRGLADEVGRDFVAFAEPEGQHVAASHAGVGDFADLGFFEVDEGLAHGAIVPASNVIPAQAGIPGIQACAAAHRRTGFPPARE
jgi:hypothetical protein